MKRCRSRAVGVPGWVVALSLVGIACAATPRGASDARIMAARERAPRGADVFARECANCHGHRGEGLSSAPATMGVGALPLYPLDRNATGNVELLSPREERSPRLPLQRTRAPFRSAADLHEYVCHWMPLPQVRMGALRAEEYWAVVNFMLIAHGVAVPPEGVRASNAASITLEPK